MRVLFKWQIASLCICIFIIMRYNLQIFFVFFVATIAGTLLHECGHAFVAMLFGFHPTIHYSSTGILSPADLAAFRESSVLYRVYPESFWILIGGPLQTIGTGVIGIVGLLVLSRKTIIDAWRSKHLLWLVLSFFMSRQVYNAVGILVKKGRKRTSDEEKLFDYLGIDVHIGVWCMLMVFGLVLAYITFALVKKHRWQLIVFGALGSCVGAVFWLYSMGRYILP